MILEKITVKTPTVLNSTKSMSEWILMSERKLLFSSSRNFVPRSGIQENMWRGGLQQSEPGPHGPPKFTQEDFKQLNVLGIGAFGNVMQFRKYPNMLSFLKRFLQINQIIVESSCRYCSIVEIGSNYSMDSEDICVQMHSIMTKIPWVLVLLIPKPNKEDREVESQLLLKRFPVASWRASGH